METNLTTTRGVLHGKSFVDLLHLLVLALSLVLLISISIDTFDGKPFYEASIYMHIQLWVCLLFLADFVLGWYYSKRRTRYFFTHLILLLVSIPYLNILIWTGWEFSPQVTYLLRFMPLVRGAYATAIVVGWFTRNRASGLFISYLVVLTATVYFSSLMFYVTEHHLNPLVTGYGDALWWAFMDVTTVGSNIIAISLIGRVLSVFLAAFGMMMFPIFTVYITNVMERREREKRQQAKATEK